MDENTRLRLIVEGDIQGVGYRALVKYIARNLKIRGFVKNLPDGTVEIFCEGDAKSISIFKRKIDIKAENGGLFSVNVENIHEYLVEELPEKAKTFDVKYGENEVRSTFEEMNLERLEIGSLILTDFRDATKSKFDTMETRYGDISRQMERLVEEFVKSNKTNAELMKMLITKLDKAIR